MIELIRREFTVETPLVTAWHHLAQFEQWPSWAKHIQQVELTPKGELTLQSIGALHLENGIRSQFRTTELAPGETGNEWDPFCG